MTAAPHLCEDHMHHEVRLEGHVLLQCGSCLATTPLPRGARVIDEARFYDALEQLPVDEILAEYEAEQRRADAEFRVCWQALLAAALIALPWIVFAFFFAN